MAIIQDWKIRSTRAQCEATGEAFVDGQQFFTCIFEDPESDGFLRRDYSAEAWKKVRKSLDPAPFSFWKSTYKAPASEPDAAESEGMSVEAMLRRFIDEDDPATENARYVLALMLEREKTLIPTDTRETETRTLLFYEHADSGDVFIVADPGLRLAEIETVQREVADLLAEEERRQQLVAATASEEGLEVAQTVSDADEDQPEQDGGGSADAEEETVPLASEEASETLGPDPAVGVRHELPDEVEDDLERTESGQAPSANDDELRAEIGVDQFHRDGR